MRDLNEFLIENKTVLLVFVLFMTLISIGG